MKTKYFPLKMKKIQRIQFTEYIYIYIYLVNVSELFSRKSIGQAFHKAYTSHISIYHILKFSFDIDPMEWN